jgi:hypothetical protein
MPEMHEMPEAVSRKGSDSVSLAFALRPAPTHFTPGSFMTRLRQHLVLYGTLLLAAVYACAFAFAPLETSAVSEAGIILAVVVALIVSPSRQRLRRLVEGGIATSYIVGAAVLVKAFDAFFRM